MGCSPSVGGKARIRIQIAAIIAGIGLFFAAPFVTAPASAQTVGPNPDLLAAKPWEFGPFVNG
ncbi:MAG TPA: hypothetical protein VN828_08240, partial [Acidobacteriaceae bacterium]|nr:hypothetical protein [Acidobacteriaceae bacterium]